MECEDAVGEWYPVTWQSHPALVNQLRGISLRLSQLKPQRYEATPQPSYADFVMEWLRMFMLTR